MNEVKYLKALIEVSRIHGIELEHYHEDEEPSELRGHSYQYGDNLVSIIPSFDDNPFKILVNFDKIIDDTTHSHSAAIFEENEGLDFPSLIHCILGYSSRTGHHHCLWCTCPRSDHPSYYMEHYA